MRGKWPAFLHFSLSMPRRTQAFRNMEDFNLSFESPFDLLVSFLFFINMTMLFNHVRLIFLLASHKA